MSKDKDRRPILYKGESYTRPIEKKTGGPRKKPTISYEDAKQRALTGLNAVKENLSKDSKGGRLPNEFVFCMRLSPEYSAKSYYPSTLFDSVPGSHQFEEVGSRLWREDGKGKEKAPEKIGKLFFVRATDAGIANFEKKLNRKEETLTEAFTFDVKKIASIDTLDTAEQILGIPADWSGGRLEVVLHPFHLDKELVLRQFLSLVKDAGADLSRIRHKQYDSGITFVSLVGNKKILKAISGYNPLRTAHPLDMRDLPIARGVAISGSPVPPSSSKKSAVTLGIFDGGIHSGNPFVTAFSSAEDSVPTPAQANYLDHGTRVAGAALYGPLNQYNDDQTLPLPNLAVRSFRILPPSDPSDPDLYEAIEAIERIVPANKDIKVFNLSLGPKGPILDDYITRFTFSCDLLSDKYDVLFCVAVGNDGKLKPTLNRIQSPSDIANGLGVGAYTKRDGKKTKAPYSCVGPGREGNKLKPDLLAFGGCDHTPIHLVGNVLGEKVSSQGTSFASPIVAGQAAQLIGYSDGTINPLVARGMLIHTAAPNSKREHDMEFGHGFMTEDLSEIVTCPKNTYTLIYQGEIAPKKYIEFKVPWVDSIKSGKVNFKWTTVVSTAVDPQSPDDYTSSSVMVAFYPNARKYLFQKNGQTKRLDIEQEKAQVKQLLADGWEQSSFPVSDSGPTPYASEDDLRAQLKWDSVDTRSVSKKIDSVLEPFFHVHAFSRGTRYATRKVKFAVILTVELSDTSVDLYSEIINKFRALAPIELTIDLPVQVEAGSV